MLPAPRPPPHSAQHSGLRVGNSTQRHPHRKARAAESSGGPSHTPIPSQGPFLNNVTSQGLDVFWRRHNSHHLSHFREKEAKAQRV